MTDKMRNYHTIKYIMFYIDFTSVGFKGESVWLCKGSAWSESVVESKISARFV